MTFAQTSLGEYYCLRAGKQSFSIDPWQDSEIYFGDRALAQRIEKRLESDFVQPRGVPKFFIHGSYGSGKTHTLAWIKHVLETKVDPYRTEPIYFDIAPLSSKERYERVHSRMLDHIGLELVRSAAETVADSIPNKNKVEGFIEAKVVPFGDEALKVSQANIFRNLLFGGRQQQQSWEWMKGRKLSPDDAQTLSVQKHLTEPVDFVNCLLNIGALHHVGTGKRLVFLIDEGEAFGEVTNPDALGEMRFALRLLLENSNNIIGTIVAVQVEGGQEAIPEIFTERGIMRRVDFEQGYIDLNGLVSQVSDAEAFVREAINYLVDDACAAAVVSSEGLATDGALFPFTKDAVEALAQHVSDNPEKAGPAAIISWMSNAAIEAWRRRDDSPSKRQLVDAAVVEETVYPEG